MAAVKQVRIWCVSRYQSAQGAYRAGQELLVDPDEAEFLLRDSPGSFTTKEPKATEKPAKAGNAPEPATIDVEAASVEELMSFAEANDIELEADASDDDVKAAIALALEERAKAKLEKAEGPAGGNTRPARRNTKSR